MSSAVESSNIAPSELLESRYKDKLEPRYEEPIHQVVTKIFRGLSGKKVIMPSKDFVRFVIVLSGACMMTQTC
jgi:hypothetical protein